MGKRVFAPVALVAAAFIFMMSFVLGGATSAQGTATPADGGVEVDPSHPAHIHSGTCEELGDVVFPLNNVTPLGVDVSPATPVDMTASPPDAAGTAGTEGTPVGAEAAGEGATAGESTTIVEASLDDILASEHAINVHESPENIQNYIACGDITGTPTNDELVIELEELNDSGFMGDALLADNGDGTTTVTITLIEMGLGVFGTPAASPAG
ncbi:MAG TPA: hypothetical protein VGR29_07760 [Thermomicrobiales bacterium]|nr:hypothetical protein [Thermomicrobiales bacterium]